MGPMIAMTRGNLSKLLAIAVVLVLTSVIWPLYRKFFINEWRERIAAGQPVVFIPDCPVVSSRFSCGDRFMVWFRREGTGQWCARVSKNGAPTGLDSCGLDIDAWDYARSMRYFTVEGVRLYYSWRGRVLTSPDQRAGWLAVPETLQTRHAHPLAMQ
jgi:hypothetical protein